jgi:hypothetical protein
VCRFQTPSRLACHAHPPPLFVKAHRLADVRKAHGLARQSDVVSLMGVSQARVSKLESGDLSHTEVGTLQSEPPR